MRIISPVHDYYDVIQKHGQDRTLVYHRQPRVVEVAGPFPFTDTVQHQGADISLRQIVIGFCGVVYPVLHLRIMSPRCTVATGLCYSLKSVDAFVRATCTKDYIEYYLDNRSKTYAFGPHAQYIRKELEPFFTKVNEKKNDYQQMFIENNCPVFVALRSDGYFGTKTDPHRIVYNPSLSAFEFGRTTLNLEFIRIMDPYRAFQEISMWVGAQAAPHRPIPSVSDADLASSKGFDKHSFRKPKGTKRNKPRWR